MKTHTHTCICRWFELCFVIFIKFNLSPNSTHHFNSWICSTCLEININIIFEQDGAERSGLDDYGELGGLLHKPNFESRTLAAIPKDAFLIFHGGGFSKFRSIVPCHLGWILIAKLFCMLITVKSPCLCTTQMEFISLKIILLGNFA